MKKYIVLSVLALLFALNLRANEPVKIFKYSIISGINLSKYRNADLKYQTGFKLGGKMRYDFTSPDRGGFLSSSGLLTMKGGREKDLENINIRAFYFEIPLHIGCKHLLNKNLSLFESVGPYAAYGLFGKTEINDNKFNTFSSDKGLKRFNFGWGINIELEIKKSYEVILSIDNGCINIYNDNAKTFDVSLCLSYIL